MSYEVSRWRHHLSARLTVAPLTIAAMALSACTSLEFGASDTSLSEEIEQAQLALEALQAREVPVVQRISTPFALVAPFRADFTWMEQNVDDFFVESLKLSELIREVGAYVPTISFSIFLEQDPTVDIIEFSGPVGNLIRLIANRYNLDFQPGPDRLVWRDQLVRVFNVAHLAGNRNFQLGRTGGDSGGGGGGGDVVSISGVDQQFADTQSEGNFWQELEAQLQTIVGGQGAVAVSNTATLVTVRAPVAEMRQVEDFFENLNRQITTQVAIDVRLIQVNLTSEYEFGVDWNLIQTQSAGNCADNVTGQDCLGISTFAKPSASTPFGSDFQNSEGSPQFSVHYLDNSASDPTEALFRMLQQQGSTQLLTNPRAVTLNNQATQISLTTRTSYLQSVRWRPPKAETQPTWRP